MLLECRSGVSNMSFPFPLSFLNRGLTNDDETAHKLATLQDFRFFPTTELAKLFQELE